MQISGKVVLITGASEGVGAACVAEFRRRGAKVAGMARRRAELEAVTGSDGVAAVGDLLVDADRRRCVAEVEARFGRVDILINNAGVGLYAPSWQAPMADVRRLYELNFFVPLEMAQLVAPGMRARRSGMIVNVGSIAGKVTLPWLSLYSASKYALGSWTDGLRMELSRDGVEAMSVCPGYVWTKFQEHVISGQPPEHVRKTKWFRITAEQCAAAIADGVEKGSRTVVTPASGWAFVILKRLFPGLMDRQLAGIYFRGIGQ